MITNCLDSRTRLSVNIWLFSLSVAFAKNINATIVLHTDELGKKLFGFLPYDEIYLTLDRLKNIPENFWAAGKIEAQFHEPLKSIHLDGDVFLKKCELENDLNFENFDLIIQNTENQQNIYKPYLLKFREVLSKSNLLSDANSNRITAFNCGIIGFNNQEIKNKYIDGYKRLMSSCIENDKFMKMLKKDRSFIPDLILEQWWLYTVASHNPCKVKALFPDINTIQADAVRIGYTHLLGVGKYKLIEKVKARLFEVNPELYKQTEYQLLNL